MEARSHVYKTLGQEIALVMLRKFEQVSKNALCEHKLRGVFGVMFHTIYFAALCFTLYTLQPCITLEYPFVRLTFCCTWRKKVKFCSAAFGTTLVLLPKKGTTNPSQVIEALRIEDKHWLEDKGLEVAAKLK